jgi:hypothetical protein
MEGRKILPVALVLVSGILLAATVLAQSGDGYELTWFTVDGGGGTVGDEEYTLQGTFGQPETGVVQSGEEYVLVGGFWPGAAVANYGVYLPQVLRNR